MADVVSSGPGLAFIVFPEALSLMPASSFFAVLFFTMLLCLGIDSAFANIEGIITVAKDALHIKESNTLALRICIVGYFVGLIYATNAGLHWLELIDHFVASYLLIPIGFMQCVAIGKCCLCGGWLGTTEFSRTTIWCLIVAVCIETLH